MKGVEHDGVITDIAVKGYGHEHLLVCKDLFMRYCIRTVTVLSVVDRIE